MGRDRRAETLFGRSGRKPDKRLLIQKNDMEDFTHEQELVSDLLVDYLERRGVTKLFGLCGHTAIGMLDALSRSKKIEYIGTRHEPLPPPRLTLRPHHP